MWAMEACSLGFRGKMGCCDHGSLYMYMKLSRIKKVYFKIQSSIFLKDLDGAQK